MIRWLIAVALVAGLAIGVWVLWPQAEPAPSTTTTVNVSTSTSSLAATTTTQSSSTTLAPQVVTTVEEAEAILAELWFGWFEGIYNQDEARIREVVGSQTALDNALAQFGVMEFTAAPEPAGIHVAEVEILRSDSSCAAMWAAVQADFRQGATSGVHVFRHVGDSWLLVSLWVHREDLWEADCESQLEPLH